jgi:hypothetical protein
MNVILAIVINMNCYFSYLEQFGKQNAPKRAKI